MVRVPAPTKVWVPKGRDRVQRVLAVPASTPPNQFQLEHLLQDKLERLLRGADQMDIEMLSVDPSLESAYADAGPSRRDKARALLRSESLYSLMSRYAETQGEPYDGLIEDLASQTLGSFAEDVSSTWDGQLE
jgi:hypothetical protein